MIPREALDAAARWGEAAAAVRADGGALDSGLQRAALGLMASDDAADQAAYRDAAVDLLAAAHDTAVLSAREAADGMWEASFGSKPAAHTGKVRGGLFHEEVFDEAACLFDGTGDPEEFSRKVRSWLAGEYDKAYDWALRDSAATVREVRYAHVPAGPKPCEHCLMMAAKGFDCEVPPRKENHPGCRCVVVPGTVDTKVEGYDPEGIAERIAKCAETVGVDPKATDEASFKAVRREMATRDTQWLLDGYVRPIVRFEEWNDDEYELAIILSSFGLPPEPIARSLNSRRADYSILGERWEGKNPKGSGFMVIWNQLKSVVFGEDKHNRNPQSDKAIISNVGNGMKIEDMLDGLARVDTDEKDTFPEVREVLLVTRETMRRVKRETK